MPDTSVATYTGARSATPVTAAQDLFSLLCPASKRIRIAEIRIDQYTDVGDAAAEIIPVLVYRGGAVGSGGAALTPTPVKSWGPASTATLRANDTTPGSQAGASLLFAGAWNIAVGFWQYPPDLEKIWLDEGERLSVVIGAPTDSLTVNQTIVFDERNKVTAP